MNMPEAKDIYTDRESGIMYQKWGPDVCRVVLLLVHGLGAHSGRWEPLAQYFAQHNISSYALELKGFGQTGGIEGHVDSFDTYFEDILSLARIIRKENPDTKIFLLGESFGGLLTFLLAHRSPELFSGLICLAPAFSIKIQVSLWDYFWVIVNSFRDPQKQFKLHFIGEMCTRDPKYQSQIDTDAREHRQVSAQFILNYFYAQRSVRKISTQLQIPVLFLVPIQDKLVSPHASKVIFYRLWAQDKEMIRYPEMYHALSVELGKEKVFADILHWLGKRS
jgi:alpha-beta hydrolase superfamily lysophospholipase